jgi:hypothetical protein
MWMRDSKYKNQSHVYCPHCQGELEPSHDDLAEWECWQCEHFYKELADDDVLECVSEDGTTRKWHGPGLFCESCEEVHREITTLPLHGSPN